MSRKIRQKIANIGVLLIALLVVSILLPVNTVLSQVENPTLVIVPDAAVIVTGQSQQYEAHLSHDGGETLSENVTAKCNWTVDDPEVGIVEAIKGLYTGNNPGGTTVRATYSPETFVRAPIMLSAEAKLIVEPVSEQEVVFQLEVVPKTAVIVVGESQQYKAYLHRSDSLIKEDVTEDATWVLAEDIATSTAKGCYRGDRGGSSLITATYNINYSDDATLYVRQRDIPERPPTIEDLPEDKIIDRQPGYLIWSETRYLVDPGAQFTMNYDDTITDNNPDRYPKVFYWNESYKKWVALASYPLAPGTVKALNDGGYSGWFVVFGCIQPRFTDITSDWAWVEPIANRMNGLGLLEGYPNPDNPDSLVRPAGLKRTITRAELTTVVARIMGLAPGETHLYPSITYMSDTENKIVLQANYSDADQIGTWARPFIAAMTKTGLVKGKGERFAPQDQMTRIEAAVLISNALRDIPGFGHPADLSVFTDADQVPAWAVGQVAEGTIGGYPDGSLRPNLPINRAESLVLLLKLLRGLGW